LSSLSAQDQDRLQPHLQHLHLPQGTALFRAEETIPYVYLPQTGIISMIVGISSGQFVEAGMLGRNGVIGPDAALDGPDALNTAIAQVESTGVMIDAGVLKGLARQSEPLRFALVHQGRALSAQTQQVAACNALHELEERLSRWLLQSRDLVQSDTLPLTQEFLSQMLGVQRSSVTMVARKLQAAGLISYRRGHIHVLDADGLQDSSCECYAAINLHFNKLIGWSPTDFRSQQVGH
jgi:CRP-like cAMP-binding protein